MIPGDNMEIIYTQIGAMADTTISTMNQLSDTIQRVYREGVNAPRNSEEYALFHSLEQYLRTLTNQSRGVAQPNAALPNVLSNLIQEAVKGNKTAISDLVKAISDLQSKLYQKDNNEEAMERLADSMGITLNDLMNSTEHHIAEMNRINTQKERYQAEQTGSFIAKAIFQNQNTAERRRDFKAEVAELIRTNPKFQGTIGRSLAEARIAERWTAQGRLSSDLVGPNAGAGGPLGADAFQRAQQATFIQKLSSSMVTAFVNSPFGQKLRNVASDLITLGMLSLANKAPAWVQKGLLLAIAMGLPQTLVQVLTQMMMTTQGRQLLGQGAKGIGQGLQWAGRGIASGATRYGAATIGRGFAAGGLGGGVLGPLVAGLVGAVSILTGIGFLLDKTVGKKDQSKADLSKWIIGLVAGIGALILAPFLPAVAAVVAIGAAIGALGFAIVNFFKWKKGRDEKNNEKEKGHFWDNWGGGDSDSNSDSDITPAPPIGQRKVRGVQDILITTPILSQYKVGEQIGGLGKDKFINTANYSPGVLIEELKKRKDAYEELKIGKGAKWRFGSTFYSDNPNEYGDIKWGAKGSSAILDAVSKALPNNMPLIVTSALGSALSKHSRNMPSYDSHYKGGGKFDFSLAHFKTMEERKAFQKALMETGYFDFAYIEGNEKDGYHIDAKIKESILKYMDENNGRIPVQSYIGQRSPKNKEPEVVAKESMVSPDKGMPDFSGNGLFFLNTMGGGSTTGGIRDIC